MKKKILFLKIIILLFLFFLLTGYTYFTNFFIINSFNSLKEKLLLEFKEITGFTLSYSNISPDIINSIKIKNVIIYKDNETYLNLGDIVVNYSIINFLKDRSNPFAFIKKITLNKLNFFSNREDLEKNIRELLDKFKNSGSKPTKNNIFSKIKNLEIKIVKSKIEIADNDRNYLIYLKNMKISFQNRIKIDSIINFELKDKNKIIIENLTQINGAISFLDNNVKTFFFIDLVKNEIQGISIKKQRFSFESNGADFFLKRIKDSLKLDLTVAKENNDLFVNVKANLSYNDIKNNIILKENKIYLTYLYLDTNLSYNILEKKINGNIYLDSFLNSVSIFKNPELIFNLLIRDNILRVNEMSLYTDKRKNFVSLDNGSIIPLDFNKFKTSIKIKDVDFFNIKLNTEIEVLKDKDNIKIGWEYFLINGEDISSAEFFIKDYKKYLNIETIKKFNGYELNGFIFRDNNNITLNLNHSFDNFLLNKFFRALNIPIKNPTFLNGSFKTDVINSELFMPASHFVIKDNLNDLLSFDINFSNKNLFIKNINLNKYNIKGNMFANFSQFPYYSNIIIKKDAFDFYVNCYIFKQSLSFDINKNFYGYFNYNNKDLHLIANDFILPFKKDQETKISFDINVGLNNLNIKESNFYIKDLKLFPQKLGNLSGSISYKDNQLLLNNINYTDDENEITGKLEQNIFIKNKILNLNGVGLFKDDKKAESYSISYQIENNKINGRIYLTHIELKKILKAEGFVDLRLGINGELKNPDIELNGVITDSKIGKNSLSSDFNIKKVDNKILFNRIVFDFGKNSVYINDSSLTLEKDNNKLLVNGSFYVNRLSKILKSDFKINSSFNFLDKKINNINSDITLNNITLGILSNDLPVQIEKYNGFSLNFSYSNNKYFLKNYGDKFLYGEYNEIDKNLIVKFYNKERAFFDLALNLDNNKLDGNVNFFKFPVNLVQKVLIPYVNINKGQLDGNVKITGNYKKPILNGRLNLYYGGVILTKYMVEPIENITAVLFIDNNKIFVNNVNGMVQKSMVHGFGEIIFNGLKFERYSFKFDSEKVPAVVKEGPIDGKGEGYLTEFIIQSDSYSFDFIGKIFLEKGEINISNMLGGRQDNREPKTYPINVILDITAGKNVKVEYPIINGTIKEGDVLTFKYIGSEPNIYLGGSINLRKGEINYFNRNFQIETATFQFYENEAKINPMVNIKSFFRTKDSKGDTMKVYLTVNDRLSSFKTELSSMPYKTQEELNALLGITFTTNINNSTSLNTNQDQYLETIINTTNYFGNTFLFSPFEATIRRITGLDTFSLNTSLFGNIIRSNDYWLDLLNDTSLTFGKYLSNEIYLGSTMTFKKKEGNEQIFLPFMYENYGLNFQFMLQFELPYVSFGYTFVPNDWRNFLNADHRLSFEANFRF